ncbi:hypothetical protein BT67DRAFT_388322 [Trichocladium antarcticum]|uniref:Uncharacterized protein n=1 Tax=Trichocladium antarcticum TaxID=1450529 RepID=A0AAN6UEA0_9PEZI|nr:hypothetical protein BT67DRAFT_388322 [Trichocladium antarcticum]
MTLSSPPEPNAWAQLDAKLVDLLDELCHVEYDSFLCAHVDNEALNIRCEYSDAESVPMRPRPPRKALKACRVAVDPQRYPSAFDWAAAFHRAAYSFLGDRRAAAPLLREFSGRDPQEDCLAGPSIHESGHVSWAGEVMIEHAATHWGCILADQTTPVDPRPNRSQADKYLLRSELLACACLMRLEINETLWEDEFRGWKLRVGNSIVKSTVVSFEDTRVRIIQSSYDPSSPMPTLVFTLRGSYTLDAGATATCSKDTVWAILWWILNPDGPSDSLIGTKSEEPNVRLPRPRTKEHRVPSHGSATSLESQQSTGGSLYSRSAGVEASS